MKTPEELAQEGRVVEAFDSILNPVTAGKHDPEEVAKIFEDALRGMPSNMRKIIEGLSDDMKIKFVQKAMRGLKGAALAFDTILDQEVPLSSLALPPEELAKYGLVKETYEQMLGGGGQGKGKGQGRGQGKGQGRGQGGQGRGGQGKGCSKGRDGQGRGGQGQGPPPDDTPEALGEQGLFTAAYEAILAGKDCEGECQGKCDDPVELAQKGQSKEAFEAILAVTRYNYEGEMLDLTKLVSKAKSKEVRKDHRDKVIYEIVMKGESGGDATVFKVTKQEWNRAKLKDTTSPKVKAAITEAELKKLTKGLSMSDAVDYNTWVKDKKPSDEEKKKWLSKKSSADKQAAVREADNAFQKELLPRLFEPVLERAINDIQGLFHDIDEGKWPNNQIEYAVMRYKPLSMTDEEFIEALYDPYSKWLNKVRP